MIVVLFSVTVREEAKGPEYDETDERLYGIVSSMPGFVSYKSYTAEDGESIGVIRFESRAALEAWRDHPEHRAAQRRGREQHFYASYDIEVSSSSGGPSSRALRRTERAADQGEGSMRALPAWTTHAGGIGWVTGELGSSTGTPPPIGPVTK